MYVWLVLSPVKEETAWDFFFLSDWCCQCDGKDRSESFFSGILFLLELITRRAKWIYLLNVDKAIVSPMFCLVCHHLGCVLSLAQLWKVTVISVMQGKKASVSNSNYKPYLNCTYYIERRVSYLSMNNLGPRAKSNCNFSWIWQLSPSTGSPITACAAWRSGNA